MPEGAYPYHQENKEHQLNNLPQITSQMRV